MHLFHRRKIQPKNYHGIFNFLSENEKVLRELDSEWQVIRHSGKFTWRWDADDFRFGSLRKLLLTDKRLILLRGFGLKDEEKEIDYEIPVDDVRSVKERWAIDTLIGIPYLKMELRNGKTVSLTFLLVGTKVRPEEKLGSYDGHSGGRLTFDTRRLIARWVHSIDDLIRSRENRGP